MSLFSAFGNRGVPADKLAGYFARSSLGIELLRFGQNDAVAYIGRNTCAWPMMEGFVGYVAATPEPGLETP